MSNNKTQNLQSVSSEALDWAIIQKDMKNKLGSDIYESWLRKIDFVEEMNSYVLLSVSTRFIRDWITSRYLDQILQIVKTYKKDLTRIEFKIIEKNSENEIENNITKNENNENVSFIKDTYLQYNRIDPNKRFDNFIRTNNNTAYSISTMTEYDPYLSCPVAFRTIPPKTTIGSIVSKMGLKQFHCAETEKYPHVTYFINGGREDPYIGEKRVLVPSPNVRTYDLKPEMSCREVGEEVINAIKNTEYKLIVVNFANGDMVGHTAIKEAIVKAMEELDNVLGEVVIVLCVKIFHSLESFCLFSEC